MIKQSSKFPLHHLIKDACDYEVSGISAFANVEPFTDESKRLCELQPCFCLLRLGERSESTIISSDYELSKLVSNMIGKSFEDYSAQRSPEVDDFRRKMCQICDDIEQERLHYTWAEKLHYEHPRRLAKTPIMPEIIRARLKKMSSNFLIVVTLDTDQFEVTSFTISANETMTLKILIEVALSKMVKVSDRSQMKISDRASDYVLKVRGREEYLFGDYPLTQFLYIQVSKFIFSKKFLIAHFILQESLSVSDVPNVVLKHIHTLPSYLSYIENRKVLLKIFINVILIHKIILSANCT